MYEVARVRGRPSKGLQVLHSAQRNFGRQHGREQRAIRETPLSYRSEHPLCRLSGSNSGMMNLPKAYDEGVNCKGSGWGLTNLARSMITFVIYPTKTMGCRYVSHDLGLPRRLGRRGGRRRKHVTVSLGFPKIREKRGVLRGFYPHNGVVLQLRHLIPPHPQHTQYTHLDQ